MRQDPAKGYRLESKAAASVPDNSPVSWSGCRGSGTRSASVVGRMLWVLSLRRVVMPFSMWSAMEYPSMQHEDMHLHIRHVDPRAQIISRPQHHATVSILQSDREDLCRNLCCPMLGSGSWVHPRKESSAYSNRWVIKTEEQTRSESIYSDFRVLLEARTLVLTMFKYPGKQKHRSFQAGS